MKSGMKALIERFYDAIETGAPLPISYREIILTATIMDDIFAHLNAGSEVTTSSPCGVSPCTYAWCELVITKSW
jgi:hypothetical protein